MRVLKRIAGTLVTASVLVLLFGAISTSAAEAPIEILHQHNGSMQEGGGCYVRPIYHVHEESCLVDEYCGGAITAKEIDSGVLGGMYGWWRSDFNESLGCEQCNMMKEEHPDGIHPWYYKKLVYTCERCKTEYPAAGTCRTVTGKSYGCKQEETVTGYGLGCGKTESDVIGSFWITSYDTNPNSQEKQLNAEVTHGPDLIAVGYSWNTGSEEQSIKVKENGVYTCTFFYEDAGVGYQVLDEFTVSDIDVAPPVITYFGADQTYTRDNVVLTVRAEDAGCGLADKAYSFDRENYGETATLEVEENGVYRVYVRDKAGNTSWAQCVVTCIDREEPVIHEVLIDDSEMAYEKVAIDILAEDTLSGLDEKPYSIDGINYQEANHLEISENGSYSVFVRDRVGNIATYVFGIQSIDKEAPTIQAFEVLDSDYTNESVTLGVTAIDTGSGLADLAYCCLKGEYTGEALLQAALNAEYVSDNAFTVTENGIYTVLVRDQVGNVGSEECTVSLIDRTPPDIVHFEPQNTVLTNQSVILHVLASDDESGLVDQPYSFDGILYEAEDEIEVFENGWYQVWVKDQAGNTAVCEYELKLIDCEAPAKPVLSFEPEEWYEGDGTIQVSVDKEGDSFPEDLLSYDGGDTWVNEFTYTVSESGTYEVILRDLAGNQSMESITVEKMDKPVSDTDEPNEDTDPDGEDGDNPEDGDEDSELTDPDGEDGDEPEDGDEDPELTDPDGEDGEEGDESEDGDEEPELTDPDGEDGDENPELTDPDGEDGDNPEDGDEDSELTDPDGEDGEDGDNPEDGDEDSELTDPDGEDGDNPEDEDEDSELTDPDGEDGDENPELTDPDGEDGEDGDNPEDGDEEPELTDPDGEDEEDGDNPEDRDEDPELTDPDGEDGEDGDNPEDGDEDSELTDPDGEAGEDGDESEDGDEDPELTDPDGEDEEDGDSPEDGDEDPELIDPDGEAGEDGDNPEDGDEDSELTDPDGEGGEDGEEDPELIDPDGEDGDEDSELTASDGEGDGTPGSNAGTPTSDQGTPGSGGGNPNGNDPTPGTSDRNGGSDTDTENPDNNRDSEHSDREQDLIKKTDHTLPIDENKKNPKPGDYAIVRNPDIDSNDLGDPIFSEDESEPAAIDETNHNPKVSQVDDEIESIIIKPEELSTGNVEDVKVTTEKRSVVEQKTKEIVKATAITAATVAGVVCVLYGCFLWMMSAVVYYRTPAGKHKRIGRVMIHKKGRHFKIVMDNNTVALAATKHIIIKLPAWFISLYQYKEMVIEYANTKIKDYVSREILVDMK